MYVCMYVCMYICMYVYMYVCIHVCIHVCIPGYLRSDPSPRVQAVGDRNSAETLNLRCIYVWRYVYEYRDIIIYNICGI